MRILQAQRGAEGPGVAGADLRLPRRAGGVDRVSAAAGAAARADPHRPAVRLHERGGGGVGAVAVPARAAARRRACAGLRADAGRARRGLRRRATTSRRWPRTSSTRTASSSARPRPTSASWSRAGSAGHRLFLNGNLQFAERDEYRYHEALVHPVMAAHGAPQQGGGAGRRRRHGGARDPQVPVGRERHAGGARSEHDAAVLATTRRWRALNGGSLSSPKVKIVNADAFQWLQQPGEIFDVIVVDFPDPTNFAIGKLYTNVFYALLDQRLSASGYAVIQTTSPLVARQSFWTVATTIESVGLHGHAVPRARAELRRMGLRHREPPAVPACPTALPEGLRFLTRADAAAAVRLSARHGARAGRGEPAVQPGPGDHLRARVGQGDAVTRLSRRALRWPRRPLPLAGCERGAGHRRAASPASTSSAATRCATARCAGAAPSSDAAHARRDRRRRRGGAGGGARAAPARASTTSCCSNWRTRPAATAAAARSAASPARSVRTTCRCPATTRTRCRTCSRNSACAGAWRAAGRTTSATCATARRSACSSTAHGRTACCRCRAWAPATLAQYRRVRAARRRAAARGALRDPDAARAAGARTCWRWTRCPSRPGWRARASTDPQLRWYLDYCCRDDYGAGMAQVSAWAGIHYFASRHGFHAPGDDDARARRGADLARRQRLARAAAGRSRWASACAPATS